jgi:hypothetical protein
LSEAIQPGFVLEDGGRNLSLLRLTDCEGCTPAVVSFKVEFRDELRHCRKFFFFFQFNFRDLDNGGGGGVRSETYIVGRLTCVNVIECAYEN